MDGKNDQKIIRAWTFYDWANSSFPLVINAAIFPAFFESRTSIRDPLTNEVISDLITVGGFQLKNSEFYSYVVAVSLVIVCLIIPLLSGIADYTGSKKKFLAFFCLMGALSCSGLYFFDANYLIISMLPFLLATIGYWASLVFYNAYLPEIATADQMDKVSAKGFSMGYLGSSILLVLNLLLIMNFKSFGFEQKGDAVRIAFLSVSFWWLGFALITLRRLPQSMLRKDNVGNRFIHGFNELRKVWYQLKEMPSLKRFLSSFFCFNMGVQTVMYMAVIFAAKEINWPDHKTKDISLIVSILLIQFLGMAGSYLFAAISKRLGNIKALKIAIFCWAIICFSVFLLVTEPLHFYITAASVGLVMGGTQALSRSTYSKLIPATKDNASFFSFYDVLEKLGIVIGTFSFGFIEGFTGSMRNSVLVLILFFVSGFLLLLTVPKSAALSRMH